MHAGKISCRNEAETGCAGRWRASVRMDIAQGTLLQDIDCSDIALWIPLAAQNQRLQSKMLCLWVSELVESLKLISLDLDWRTGWESVRSQRRGMKRAVLFQSQRRYTLEVSELFRLRIRSIPVHIMSFHLADSSFIPDTPVYPAAAATCWFESTSSRPPPCWPLRKPNVRLMLFYIHVLFAHPKFLCFLTIWDKMLQVFTITG